MLEYDKHFKVNYSQNKFAKGKSHIYCRESFFWSYTQNCTQ